MAKAKKTDAHGHEHAHEHDHDEPEKKKGDGKRFREATVTETGPCKRRVKIAVDADRIRAKIEERYADLSENAALPGFRAGRAPRALVEKRFQKEVADETKSSLMAEALEAALEEKGLSLLSDPEPVESSVTFDPEKGLDFEADIVIRPVFEPKPYDKIRVETPSTEVTAGQIDEAIEHLRYERAQWGPLEGGAPGPKDLRVGTASFSTEGREAWKDAVEIMPERGWIGPCPVENLVAKLEGKGAGSSLTFEVEMPQTHPEPELRGRKGTLSFSIEEVKRARLPELDDAFAKSQRCESVEDLRGKVARMLQAERERDADLAVRHSVREQLVKENTFDLPEELVQQQAVQNLRRTYLQLRMRGVDPAEIQKHLEDLQKDSLVSAVFSLRSFFILEEIAKKEKIFATEEEVERRIRALADREGVSVERIRQRLERTGDLSELRSVIRHEAVEDLILQRAGAPSPKKPGKGKKA
ncbi:MAG: trigger factor [Planctomycetes bacterium]|nr:trigger factor [Planctomycetota bacterium]